MVFSVSNMNDDELVAILLSTLDAGKQAGDSRYFNARTELLKRHQSEIVKTLGRYGIPSNVALDAIEAIIEKLTSLAGSRKRINFKQFIIENAVRMSKEVYSRYKTQFIKRLVIEGILTAASVFILSIITLNLYFKQRPETTVAYITGQYNIQGKSDAKTAQSGDTIYTRRGKAELYLRNRTLIQIDSGTTVAINTLDLQHLEATLNEGHIHASVDPLKQNESYRIQAGDASIAVIGTEFDIIRTGNDISVSVVHGRVRIEVKGVTNESWPDHDFVYSNYTIIQQVPVQTNSQSEPEKDKGQLKKKPVPVRRARKEEITEKLPGPLTIQAKDFDTVQDMKVVDSVEGKVLGYINKGSKATYIVKLPKTGYYRIEYRVSCPDGKGRIKFNSSNNTESETTDILKTGGWESWKTVEAAGLLPLKANRQEIQIEALGPAFNFNWLRLTYVKPLQ